MKTSQLPTGLTFDQVRHHYEVEKRLADQLRNSTKEERTCSLHQSIQ